jgi:hypothetical protein
MCRFIAEPAFRCVVKPASSGFAPFQEFWQVHASKAVRFVCLKNSNSRTT